MQNIDSYRGDGWPLCPRCGEDELWVHKLGNIPLKVPVTTIPELYFEEIFTCYTCNWSGKLRSIKEAMRSLESVNQGQSDQQIIEIENVILKKNLKYDPYDYSKEYKPAYNDPGDRNKPNARR